MEKVLNKKQRGFVRDFVKTGNGTEAVLNNYAVKSSSNSTASTMSTENLKKPHVQRAIARLMEKTGLDDGSLLRKHQALLNREEFVVKNNNKTGKIEIISTGQIDKTAVRDALDMAYKIKGHYVKETKDTNQQINIALILNKYE